MDFPNLDFFTLPALLINLSELLVYRPTIKFQDSRPLLSRSLQLYAKYLAIIYDHLSSFHIIESSNAIRIIQSLRFVSSCSAV
jgi:hypothetical protein